MDGASKFVRGEAIASPDHHRRQHLRRHRHRLDPPRHAAGLRQPTSSPSLSVGDGLVSQIPALVVSLAAGLLVSKGGNRRPGRTAPCHRPARPPIRGRCYVAADPDGLRACRDAGPSAPCPSRFSARSPWHGHRLRAIPRSAWKPRKSAARKARARCPTPPAERGGRIGIRSSEALRTDRDRDSALASRSPPSQVLRSPAEIANRVAKMRRKFALRTYGFVVPEIKVTERPERSLPRLTRSRFTAPSWPLQETAGGRTCWWCTGAGRTARTCRATSVQASRPSAWSAIWIPQALRRGSASREGFAPVDQRFPCMLTHVSEVDPQQS